MNNYQQFINNFMEKFPKSNSFEQKNVQNEGLYNPYQGFIRGNMFKTLYQPYKLNKPYDIKPMNEQAEMLTYIDGLCFACIDLELYLDTHPDDRDILNLFNQYRQEKNEMVKRYESQFGPLTLDSDSLKNYPWVWNEKPWPWDN